MNRFLLTLSMAFGVVFIAGLWIPLKAIMAQELLTLAWAESQARQQPARPWPWADTWPVARLQLAADSEPLIVLDGVHGESLAFGPGRLPGTGRAVVIAGHRDTHFQALQALSIGAPLRYQDSQGQWRHYEVVAIRVVDSRREGLRPEQLAPEHLLLVTCYPFDSLDSNGPLRYLVEARPVGPVPWQDNRRTGIANTDF
ncbi:MAG: class GN sortase [Marinobacter sp.]|uniref:class GN sortase n=1 Tax=Marinobacter sp. TaxID=50741 RepID=UPI00299EBA07|nr:class GN sortase [Marinobacter sp.]MDX1634810.1 class GN sortase [Marinobacter sp.]